MTDVDPDHSFRALSAKELIPDPRERRAVMYADSGLADSVLRGKGVRQEDLITGSKDQWGHWAGAIAFSLTMLGKPTTLGTVDAYTKRSKGMPPSAMEDLRGIEYALKKGVHWLDVVPDSNPFFNKKHFATDSRSTYDDYVSDVQAAISRETDDKDLQKQLLKSFCRGHQDFEETRALWRRIVAHRNFELKVVGRVSLATIEHGLRRGPVISTWQNGGLAVLVRDPNAPRGGDSTPVFYPTSGIAGPYGGLFMNRKQAASLVDTQHGISVLTT